MDIEPRQAEREYTDWLNDDSEKLEAAAYAKDLETSFDEESEKLDTEDLEAYTSFEAEMNAIEAYIKAAKKTLRGSNLPMTEKLAAKLKISKMEGRRDKLKLEFFERRASIRAKFEAMVEAMLEVAKGVN